MVRNIEAWDAGPNYADRITVRRLPVGRLMSSTDRRLARGLLELGALLLLSLAAFALFDWLRWRMP